MFPTFLLIIIFIYVLLYLLDKFYKTCAHYPYIQCLKNTGFEINFFQIKWETTAFNRILLKWGTSHSSFINTWFTIGLNVTLFFLPVALGLLIISIYQMFFTREKPTIGSNSSILVPIVPGANLPLYDLPYYILSLVISSVFHEFGHALIAIKEDVHLSRVGISCLFILPIAYVSLNRDDISKLQPLKSLKIFCAGVWHNLILSLVAYVIFITLPYLLSPFYTTNNGLIVTELSPNSPLHGDNGLSAGNQIFKINDCTINNYYDWAKCTHKYRNLKPGFCTPSDVISTYDETVFIHSNTNEFKCCNDHHRGSVCFEYLENSNGVLEIPPHTCLPVRTVVQHSKHFCNSSSDCPQNTHCIKPTFTDRTNILVIEIPNRQVVYLGLSDDLYLTVTISEYVPKYDFLSLNLPNVVEKFFKYIVVISLGLAIVNVIPSLAMDGHFISNALIKLLLGNRIKNEHVYFGVTLLVPFCGTALFSILVLHTIWFIAFK